MSEKNTNTNAVAKTTTTAPARRAPSIEVLLTGDDFKGKLQNTLPKFLNADNFVEVVATQLKKTPKLAKCEPVSFFAKLKECADAGLKPNGKQAHLIPFENRKAGTVECNLVIGFQGLAMLARRCGNVKSIYCETWFKGDTLTNDTGDIHHIVDYTADRQDPAKFLGVVCVVKFADGFAQGIVMPKADIITIRNRAQSYVKAKKYGIDCPWETDFYEMAKKTAFRRLAKWLDISPEFEKAVEIDNDDYIDTTAVVVDAPAPATVKQIGAPAPAAAPANAPAEEQEPEPVKVLPNAGVAETGAFTEAQNDDVFG